VLSRDVVTLHKIAILSTDGARRVFLDNLNTYNPRGFFQFCPYKMGQIWIVFVVFSGIVLSLVLVIIDGVGFSK
jgi:hypothetical protein